MLARTIFLCTLTFICTLAEGGVKLRHRWENRPVTSSIAKRIYDNQHNCGLERRLMGLNNYGMGSGLISLSHAMCTGLHLNAHVALTEPYTEWIWNDKEFCKTQNYNNSELACYFGPVYNLCPDKRDMKGVYWVNFVQCPSIVNHPGNLRAAFSFHGAFFEYLFSQVNPEIVRRAEVEAKAIFGPNGSPSHMITVHIR